MIYDLREVPLFSGLSRDDIERLSVGLTEHLLAEGDQLFEEGDAGDRAYVIADGEIEILKDSADRRVRVAISGPGDVVGEMSLLTAEPRSATAVAHTACRLIGIPKACLDDVLSTSVEANRALFEVFISRWREQESRVRQSERMAQLGVLTAGLAHEMNNPAAAVSAGSEQLRTVIDDLAALERALPPSMELPEPSDPRPNLSALERADREDEIEVILEAAGVEEAWKLSGTLVDAGFTPTDLSGLSGDAAATALRASATRAETDSLLREVHEGSARLSALVSALKSYSFHDQAPVQDVDVVKGIEDTLLILRSKLKDIEVVRDFDDLRPITALGSQLNQVWTNLIDNAADAINDGEVEDGRIILRARDAEDGVTVEVENNGPGIPPEVADRIFEAFFTTKEPGRGTGLGLDTVYSIVVTQHRGTIDVASEDGSTVFTVTIPRDADPG